GGCVQSRHRERGVDHVASDLIEDIQNNWASVNVRVLSDEGFHGRGSGPRSIEQIALNNTYMDHELGRSRESSFRDEKGVPFEFVVYNDVDMMRGLGQDGVRRTEDDYYAVLADYAEGVRVLNPLFRKSPLKSEFGVKR